MDCFFFKRQLPAKSVNNPAKSADSIKFPQKYANQDFSLLEIKVQQNSAGWWLTLNQTYHFWIGGCKKRKNGAMFAEVIVKLSDQVTV